MLVLTRREDDKFVINGNIEVTVIQILGDRVRLGIEAPRDVSIYRQEIWVKIEQELKQGDKA